ncbi:hypothetical protein SS50377_21297 [Spironucleus salmonicida]|uniref:Uncharacterized protein n=1 Tax=Spironucleus salmonicida TaxID=348837 RepID=A0A9P8S088_9EUKA|nr:hypothetical protein SS50377_21297 [Spironucleus salmonicida]
MLKKIYEEPLYEICKKNYDSYEQSSKVKMLTEKENQYEHIRLFENDLITCTYVKKDRAFTLSKEQLLDHLTVYRSIISKFEDDIVYLTNGVQFVNQLFKINSTTLINFNTQESQYFIMLLNGLRQKKYKPNIIFLSKTLLQDQFNTLATLQTVHEKSYRIKISLIQTDKSNIKLEGDNFILEKQYLTFKATEKVNSDTICGLFFRLKIVLDNIVDDVAHIVFLPE